MDDFDKKNPYPIIRISFTHPKYRQVTYKDKIRFITDKFRGVATGTYKSVIIGDMRNNGEISKRKFMLSMHITKMIQELANRGSNLIPVRLTNSIESPIGWWFGQGMKFWIPEEWWQPDRMELLHLEAIV
jgi:hypothetical protein